MPEEKGKLTDTILQLLKGTGKPFSVNGLLKELPKDQKKPNVEKALDKLVDSGKIVEKTFGKKKIYFAKQAKVDPTKLLEQRNSLNERNSALDKELSILEQTAKSLEGEMKQQAEKIKQDPDNELSNAEVKENISKLQTKLDSLSSQKDKLAANRPKTSSKLTKADYEKAWRKRKRIVKDIMDTILENSEMTKAKIIEAMGIETDEDAGVTLP